MNIHKTILKEEVLLEFKNFLQNIQITNNLYFIDGTTGFGGHSLSLIQDYNNLKFLLFDLDLNCLQHI